MEFWRPVSRGFLPLSKARVTRASVLRFSRCEQAFIKAMSSDGFIMAKRNHTMATPSAVRIVEVGPRDGLQNIKTTIIPTATKLELISRLQQTGLKTIEITSVVSPNAVPQLADCRQVLADGDIRNMVNDRGLRVPVLIPNLKGLEIALENGVREVAVFVSATEGFSRANINASVDEGLARARQVTKKATAAGRDVRGYVSCIFADPFDGPTPQANVLKVVKSLLDMGCYEVSLGDTLGIGTANDVKGLLEYLLENGVHSSQLAGHFHDTYGQAVGNVWQAYQCGLRVFDSSVGGLGGCPFAPGAKGNAATEDLVYMFEQAGCDTGVDLAKLVDVGNWISAQLKKPNESRAGVALSAKQALLQAKGRDATQPRDRAMPELSWTLVSVTESIKTYRSGVNLKAVLNQPKKGNALTIGIINELTQTLQNARNDSSISRIIITGEGKFFCAGMDLGTTSPVAQTKEVSDAQYERLTKLFEAIDNAPQVTIAAMNGPAFGGGVGLAFACDIRIAAKGASVTLSETKLGLCPATISKYVIREWGLAFTREAMLSARPISVAELRSLGLVTKIVEEQEQLAAEVDKYLIQLRIAGPEASSMCKQLIKLGWANAGSEAQERGVKHLFDKMMRSGEAAIGLRAFQTTKKALDWDEITATQRAAATKAKL